MRVLFVDSGAGGFHYRYAFDISTTLKDKLRYKVKQVNPQRLSPRIIREYRPDVLLVVHGNRTPCKHVRFARSLGAKTVLWLVEDPYEIDLHRGEMVDSYDVVFTNERQAVTEYQHPRAYYLPWCCNPEVHRRLSVTKQYQSDLCFVGMGFPNRLLIINALAPLLKRLNVKLIGEWNRWGEVHPDLRKFVLPVVNNFYEVQKYFNGAKINLNIHRDPVEPPSGNSKGVGATSPNDRAFALAGCGAFQIVDSTRPDLLKCFEDEKEIIRFSNPDDLAKKIEYYLARPGLRGKIGDAAQKRAYGEHTYKHRFVEMFGKLGALPRRKEHRVSRKPVSYVFNTDFVIKDEIWSFQEPSRWR
jgi:spore maturation protein CgeB